MQKPVDLEYGTVHDVHYRADFGSVEARVRLFQRDAPVGDTGFELLTSVIAIADEPEESLNTRLVVSAARLYRQFEIHAAYAENPDLGTGTFAA